MIPAGMAGRADRRGGIEGIGDGITVLCEPNEYPGGLNVHKPVAKKVGRGQRAAPAVQRSQRFARRGCPRARPPGAAGPIGTVPVPPRPFKGRALAASKASGTVRGGIPSLPHPEGLVQAG
ncbi:hypothetical protein [Paracoccus mutanolyticus]|uniref:hypothetical protein n=1 Tax=Paracoccus mutanolyticus TaxID=1499308 RepID=UPI0011AE8851|nr:hypothetical protein [Paracoccus mutanolyticus]